MFLESQNILIISNEPWGNIWYSKHNYAYELSKNNKVFFINPTKKWSLNDFFFFNVTEEFYSSSLSIVSYNNFIPAKGAFLSLINNYVVSKKLKNWLKKEKSLKNYIFWSFDPIRLYNHKLLDARIGIFHCVDLYNKKFFGEKIILKNSDIMFSISKTFNELYNEFKLPKHIIPHAIPIDHFIINDVEKFEIDNELKKLGIEKNNFGLFIGSIDHRTNLNLLNLLADEFPQKKFVLIGDSSRINQLNLKENIIFLGVRSYDKLKYYVYFSEFCFSFLNQEQNNTINSHKILIYLAQGKPIFSSFYEDYKDTDKLLYMGRNNKEIKELLLHFINNGEELENKKKRIQYAQNYTFEKTLLKIEKILSNFK